MRWRHFYDHQMFWVPDYEEDKAISFSCYVLIYLSLENYIASVVVLWRQAYFQGAAQQRWSPWNHSCCHGIGATTVLKQCTVQWCCQRIGPTTVHTEHTVHTVAHTVLLSQNWCYNRAKSAQCSAHSVVATDLVPFHSFHWDAADAGVDSRP